MMAAYFEEDRFRPRLAAMIRASNYQTPPVGKYWRTPPVTKEWSIDGGLRSSNPTFGETAMRGDIFGLANEAANTYVTISQGNRIDALTSEMAQQLPSGEEYTAVITNPGGYGGEESVALVRGPDANDAYLHSPGDRTFMKKLTGNKDSYGDDPTTVDYTGLSGERSQARIRNPYPSFSPPSNRAPQNVIDYEPSGRMFENPYVPPQLNPGSPGLPLDPGPHPGSDYDNPIERKYA